MSEIPRNHSSNGKLLTFRKSAMASGAALAGALARGDLRGVGNAAHKLKSGASSIGAARLVRRCEDLETAAAAGQFDIVAGSARQFEADLQAVLDWLEYR